MNHPYRAAAGIVLILAFSFQGASPAEYSNLDTSSSEMRPLIERYAVDRGNILRFYNIPASPERRARLRRFYDETKAAMAAQNFDAMSQDGKVDYILFRNEVDHELRRLALDEKEEAENAVYLPFSATIIQLEEERAQMKPLDPVKTAQTLGKLNKDIDAARQSVDARLRAENGAQAAQMRRIVGNRAANELAQLRNSLRTWFTFYDGYDSMFTWWDEEAYRTVDTSLQNYTTLLRERVAGLRTATADPVVVSGAGRGG